MTQVMEQLMEAPQELAAALTEHSEALAIELRALHDMPQVKLGPGAVFDRAKPPGSNAQKRGVICRLRCCGKPLDQKCNELVGEAACPTHVDAARIHITHRGHFATPSVGSSASLK